MIYSYVEYAYDEIYTTINKYIFKVDLVTWKNKQGIKLGKKRRQIVCVVQPNYVNKICTSI